MLGTNDCYLPPTASLLFGPYQITEGEENVQINASDNFMINNGQCLIEANGNNACDRTFAKMRQAK
jgi:hypothetical protein